MFRLLFLMVPLAFSACAFVPGQPFANFDVSFGLSIDRPDGRVLDAGFERSLGSHDVKLDMVTLEDIRVDLFSAAVSSASTSFDPANPPPGYTLCHNGHCHASDGSLVDYEDIEAELAAASGGGLSAVGGFSVGRVAIGDDPAAGSCATDRCDGQFGSVRTILVEAGSVNLSGSVRDRDTMDETPFSLSMNPDREIWDLSTAIDMNREMEPNIRVDLAAIVDVGMFDDVDWTEFVGGGSLPAADQTSILTWLADDAEPALTVTRQP